MFGPGLAQKPRLWLGFWGLWLSQSSSRAVSRQSPEPSQSLGLEPGLSTRKNRIVCYRHSNKKTSSVDVGTGMAERVCGALSALGCSGTLWHASSSSCLLWTWRASSAPLSGSSRRGAIGLMRFDDKIRVGSTMSRAIPIGPFQLSAGLWTGEIR